MAGIYIHIPFCHKACNYCDFHFSTSLNNKDDLLRCLLKELEQRRSEINNSVSSIYFGGGTPSVLTINEIKQLIDECFKHYKILDDLEVTLEANPEDISIELINGYAKAGINRLSIGVQSFQDNVLEWMNRSHSSKQATDCINWANQAGITNISVDLIYGVPEELQRNWILDLETLISLNVTHISAYNLTVEEKTVLHKLVKEKKQLMPDQDICNDAYDLLVQTLKLAGFEQYEVSNFSKKGFQSRHNSAYWHRAPYLGIGPSAHSFNGQKTRSWNVSNNRQYIKQIDSGICTFETEELTDLDIANEIILLGTRTKKGVSINKILKYLNTQQKDVFLKQLDELKKKRFIITGDDHLYVNEDKRFYSDHISRELIILPT